MEETKWTELPDPTEFIEKHQDILVKFAVSFYVGAIWWYILTVTLLLGVVEGVIGYDAFVPLLEDVCSFFDQNPHIVSVCMIYCNILNYIIQPLQSIKEKSLFIVINTPCLIHNIGVAMMWWGPLFIR